MYIEAINLCWYYVKFIREKSKMFFKWHLYASVWNSVILLVDFLSVIWLQSVFTFRWYADILKKLMPKHVFIQMHYVIATKECWISNEFSNIPCLNKTRQRKNIECCTIFEMAWWVDICCYCINCSYAFVSYHFSMYILSIPLIWRYNLLTKCMFNLNQLQTKLNCISLKVVLHLYNQLILYFPSIANACMIKIADLFSG